MSHFVDSLLIFHRMLDFCLAHKLQFDSIPKHSPQTLFPLISGLCYLGCCLEYLYTRLHNKFLLGCVPHITHSWNLACSIQYVSKDGLVQLGLMWRRVPIPKHGVTSRHINPYFVGLLFNIERL
jgi:hypothetical protein